MDTHSAHTEHDPCRNDCGYDRTADHEPVGERLADAMRHHDPTSAGRKMREDEERAEPIVRHEADVPAVLDQSGGRASRPDPVGVNPEIGPRKNEDRSSAA